MRMTILLTLTILTTTIHAQLRLPRIFSDSMILQRDAPIRLWGWASPGESISIQFHNQQQTAKADAKGEWKASLAPEKAGGPYTLTLKGKTTIALQGILMGDIWVCSGQSNMEMMLSGWGKVLNAEQEIAAANYPAIRLFTVEKAVEGLPATDIKGAPWQTCNPQSATPFSAVGYFFGRALHQQLQVPIGLINTSWGGTDIESWISHAGFATEPYYAPLLKIAPARSTADMNAIRDQQTMVMLKEKHLDNIDTSNLAQWPALEYDDRQWGEMTVPGLWEQQQLGANVDGVVWFRKEIVLAEADAGKAAVLRMSTIDDNDVMYVNGVRVGSTNGYNVQRVYKVAAGLLKAGKNVITVMVEDTGGGGGVYGDAADCSLTIDGKILSLAGAWKFRLQQLRLNKGVGPNDYPSVLYNAMVAPITKLAIKGVIWYQGENNAGRAVEYRKAMPLLINDWRQRWQQPTMPFYFVQLSSFNAALGNSNKGSMWAELREAQAYAAKLPNTGMAVTIDVGDAVDIHPRNKQDVGKRLAALALQKTYGMPGIACGPVFNTMQLKGSSIALQFTHTGKGLTVKSTTSDTLKGFEIAGADKRFYPATATINGSIIMVTAPEVKAPVAVRYAWMDEAGAANLFNKDGFPAAPFRTDNWKLVTAGNKYKPALLENK